MENDLLSLPRELQIQVLANLDALSLVRTSMTCSSLREVFKSSSQLSYILQLYLDGLSDAGSSRSHADLLADLLKRRQARFALSWKECRSYHMRHGCLAYELVGGLLATVDGHHLELAWLQVPLRERTSREPIVHPTGVLVRDFAMDPTQDLIVFFEENRLVANPHFLRLYIRTISKNDTHPRAQQSVLQHPIDQPRHAQVVYLQVARDRVMLYVSSAHEPIHPQVLVWDWTTSELIMNHTFTIRTLFLPFDFSLLDSRFCFITYAFDSGSIWLYEIGAHPTLLAKLHLPPISMGTSIARMTTHASPIEANPLPGISFVENDDDRLHAVTVVYRYSGLMDAPDDLMVTSVNLFVHQRVFTKYCKQRLALGGDDSLPLEIPWEEWGPSNTRMIHPPCIQFHWLRYIHGQRVVFPLFGDPDVRGGASFSVQMLDFSLAAILTAHGNSLTSSSDLEDGPGALMPPSMISALNVPSFKDDVETLLPCVSLKRVFRNSYTGYMVYEDGIVGINMQDEDDSLRIDVYSI